MIYIKYPDGKECTGMLTFFGIIILQKAVLIKFISISTMIYNKRAREVAIDNNELYNKMGEMIKNVYV